MSSIFAWLLSMGLPVLALALFLVLTVTCEVGFQVGRWRGARYTEHERASPAPAVITAGMLSLLAFILGLTINFAQSRFEARRGLVNAEANAIDTAWLRARMVGGPQGDAIAVLIQSYAQTRLAFTATSNTGPQEVLNERTSEQEAQIWARATLVARDSPSTSVILLVPALNEMFDSAQSQRFAFVGEPPASTLDMLLAAAILAIGAMGFQFGVGRQRHPILTSLLLLMWTAGMVVTVDLGHARAGQIQVDPRPLQWTLRDMRRAAVVLPAAAPAPPGSPTRP